MTAAIGLAAAGLLVAQTPAGSDSFEVASVKPGDTSFPGMSIYSETGRLSVTNATLKFLIGYAWKLQNFQIYGAPGWANSELFSIEAKPGDAKPERLQLKFRHLLEERFSLNTHEEERILPVYELAPAKGGPKLTRVAGPPTGGITTGPGLVKVNSGSIGMFAETLAGQVGRPVLDRTAIEGAFDIKLRWAPDVESQNANGPSLFTAIQEQVGLKLESSKGRVKVLVIDQVERPSAN